MPKAFIINDYQNDLISEDGALFCGKEAQSIDSAICDYIERFIVNGDFVAVCMDTHRLNDPYHPETALFPPHSLQGCSGHKLYGKVAEKVAKLQTQVPQQIVLIEKCRYSAFSGTPLDIWLRSRRVQELTLAGVCTDMCVLHTAIDAYNLAYKVIIPRVVCYTPNAIGEEFAFAHFVEAMGIQVI